MESNINLTDNKIIFTLNKILMAVFIIYIFLVLSFGRAFAIINIGNIFITELILFLCSFLILTNINNILKIPRSFLITISIYFVLGCVYFFYALTNKRFFALRDVVFFVYLLFLPITFVTFSFNKNWLKIFLIIVIASNIVGLTIVRLCIYRGFPWNTLHELFGKTRAFNYGLYFGISLSFLINLFIITKKKAYQLLLVLICTFNVYLTILWGERSSYLTLFVLFIFMVFFFKKNIFKFLIYFLVIFLIIFPTFLLLMDTREFKTVLPSKLISFNFFLKDLFTKSKNIQPLLKAKEEKNTQKSKNTYLEDVKKPVSLFSVIVDSDIPQQDKDNFSNIHWRIEIWKSAINFGFKSPIFGRGFGVLPISIPPPRGIGINSGIKPIHNHLLTIFCKMGILGIILFFFVNFYAFLYGLLYLKECKDAFLQSFLRGALSSFILWHILALFFDVIDSPPTSIFIWIILGLIFACVYVDKNNSVLKKNEDA